MALRMTIWWTCCALGQRLSDRSIEDGMAEDDWTLEEADGRARTARATDGDDLFVTNPERLRQGIAAKVATAF